MTVSGQGDNDDESIWTRTRLNKQITVNKKDWTRRQLQKPTGQGDDGTRRRLDKRATGQGRNCKGMHSDRTLSNARHYHGCLI